MSETVFENSLARVRADSLVFGTTNYPFSLIEDATYVVVPVDIITWLINAALIVGGAGFALWGVPKLSLGAILAGAAMAALGGFVLKSLKPRHLISLDLHDGRAVRLESSDGPSLKAVYQALEQARLA